MWFLGCIIKSEGLALCGNGLLMLNLILAGLLGYVLRVQLRQQMRRITLTGEPISSLVLEEPGRTRRLEFANARVLGWNVADAPYIQLRIEDESGFALRLFLSPEQRHVVLTAGFRVLDTYEGWSPITRSNELLDLLAPFILPGELAEFGDDRDLE
jgi:hypothetical protein